MTLPLHRSPCSRAGGSAGPASSGSLRGESIGERGPRRRGVAAVDRAADQRQHALLGVEGGPRVVRAVRLRERSDPVVPGVAEPRRPRGVQRGEAVAEPIVVVEGRRRARHVLEGEERDRVAGRRLRHDLGDPQRPRLRQPAQSVGFGAVGIAGETLARLDEDAIPARPARFVGVVDVAAGDPRQGRLAAPEARGHDREQRGVHDAAPSRSRTSASRPRQPASQMSNTSSKPSAPP